VLILGPVHGLDQFDCPQKYDRSGPPRHSDNRVADPRSSWLGSVLGTLAIESETIQECRTSYSRRSFFLPLGLEPKHLLRQGAAMLFHQVAQSPTLLLCTYS
jgi:hypothetical protein